MIFSSLIGVNCRASDFVLSGVRGGDKNNLLSWLMSPCQWLEMAAWLWWDLSLPPTDPCSLTDWIWPRIASCAPHGAVFCQSQSCLSSSANGSIIPLSFCLSPVCPLTPPGFAFKKPLIYRCCRNKSMPEHHWHNSAVDAQLIGRTVYWFFSLGHHSS